MTGTFAGQVVMEGFLDWKVAAWKRLAVTRAVALVPSMLVAIATSNHENTSDSVDEWLNILQSVQLPFALLPLLYFTNSEKVMGKFKNSTSVQVLGYVLGGIVILTNFYLLVDFVIDRDSDTPNTTWFYCVAAVFGILYVLFLYAVTRKDIQRITGLVCGSSSSSDETGFVALVDDDEVFESADKKKNGSDSPVVVV